MDHARRKYLIANPAEVAPEEFSYRLLDAIFREQFGYGGSGYQMTIGGIKFTQTIKPIFSNSMKNRVFKIKIFSDGYYFENKTPYDHNKRNRT